MVRRFGLDIGQGRRCRVACCADRLLPTRFGRHVGYATRRLARPVVLRYFLRRCLDRSGLVQGLVHSTPSQVWNWTGLWTWIGQCPDKGVWTTLRQVGLMRQAAGFVARQLETSGRRDSVRIALHVRLDVAQSNQRVQTVILAGS